MTRPSRLDAVLAEFTSEFGARLSTPAGAYDICDEISAEFIHRCTAAGVPAEPITGARFSTFMGTPVIEVAHTAALVDGITVYDWTARQFNPDADVPVVQPLQKWRDAWRPLSIPK